MANVMQVLGILYLNRSTLNSAINRTDKRSRPNSINSPRSSRISLKKEVCEKLEKLNLVDEKLETLQEIKAQITVLKQN